MPISTRPILFRASLLVLLVFLLPVSCKKDAPPPPPKPEVQVAKVVAKDIELHTEWVGTTVGMVDAQIRARVDGYLLSQEYEDGAKVERGALLFQIDPRQFQAAFDSARALLDVQKAVLRKHELDVERFEPLVASGAVSRRRFDDSIQARAASRASVAAAKAEVEEARLNLGWTQIRSPIDGIAGIAAAQVGNSILALSLLTTVSQVDPIKVNFSISEIDYLRFARRRDARAAKGEAEKSIEIQLVLADGSKYPHSGEFKVADRAVSETTGTITLQGVFPNSDDLLRPGQYAKVRIATDLRKGALVIPKRAVKQTQGKNQVAVVDKDDKVTLVAIELGPRTDDGWIVEKGLKAGQQVIVEGLQKVRTGMVVTPKAPKTAPAASSPNSPSDRQTNKSKSQHGA